jgi:predicted O-linked N-acetylglucosamine transferase (SPINDLY family)
LRLWARVLIAVPQSRLLLKAAPLADGALCEALAGRFERHGIGRHRLQFEGPASRADYLRAYGRVDIALDPFPFTGATTTVEALWMGVPVLTMSGDRMVQRQGTSLLALAGLPDWIAAAEDEYVARAAAFARDRPRLTTLRAGLRARLLASPICDASAFAKEFQAAIWGMWRARND